MRLFLLLWFCLIPATQDTCPNEGTARVTARWEAGPVVGCGHAPWAPLWMVFTPEHREVVPKSGYQQGNARLLPVWLIPLQCTGSPTLPVLPGSMRVMGYVFDVEEEKCGP